PSLRSPSLISPRLPYTTLFRSYGDTAIVPTGAFLYGLEPETEVRIDFEPGVSMLLELESISAPDENGMRSVICMLNGQLRPTQVDRKSTRLNSSHVSISYAVFC